MMNGVIYVVQAGKTTYEDLKQGLKALSDIDARCLGVVINGLDLKESNRYYHRYYGYYYAPTDEQRSKQPNET
jgi:Mrp family chromosome partitioning ATPase